MEAAMVFTALTAVIGLVVAGVIALATYLGAVGMARDAARAAALDNGAAARAAAGVIAESDPDARVTVQGAGPTDPTENGGQTLLRVTVTVPGTLLDISASAVIVSEPS